MTLSPQKTSSFNKYNTYSQTPNRSLLNNDPNSLIISQLKTKIFDLEQNSKNFDNLLSKYKTLQKEHSLLIQDKLTLEYQLKQTTESLGKNVSLLQQENDVLTNKLKDKLCLNKTLYTTNTKLSNELDETKNLLNTITDDVSTKTELINTLVKEKKTLESRIIQLQDQQRLSDSYVNKLENEIKQLKNENEHHIEQVNLLNKEIRVYQDKIDKMNNDSQGNVLKLQNKEDTIIQLKSQIESLKQNLNNLDQHNVELNSNVIKMQNEITTANAELIKERTLRGTVDQSLLVKENEIQNKIKEIDDVNNNYNVLKKDAEKLAMERDELLIEIEKFKSHIMVLTEANKELMDELDLVIERDEQMKELLDKESEDIESVYINDNTNTNNTNLIGEKEVI
jgi:chromosome segregation ATPase